MPGIALNNALTSGHGTWPPSTVPATSATVFVNGQTVLLDGDTMIPHTQIVKPYETHAGAVQATTSSVFVEGKKVARMGDPLSCGDTVALASANVMAG